jgi:hypothetical protein
MNTPQDDEVVALCKQAAVLFNRALARAEMRGYEIDIEVRTIEGKPISKRFVTIESVTRHMIINQER